MSSGMAGCSVSEPLRGSAEALCVLPFGVRPGEIRSDGAPLSMT